MRIIIVLSALFLFFAPTAQSIQKSTLAQEGLLDLEDEWGQIWKPAPTPPGALDWNTLINVKIKKKTNDLQLDLEKTTDIAAFIGHIKKTHQLIVGFALETNNELENAQKKLVKKNFDFIVLNSLQDKGAGFNHDTNKVTFVDKSNNIEQFKLKSKQDVAFDIVQKLISMLP